MHTLLEHKADTVLFSFIRQPAQVERLLRRRPLVFTGHIHDPGYWEWDLKSGALTWHPVSGPFELTLAAGKRYLVQIGSLGEPIAPEYPRYLVWDESQVEWRSL